MIILGLTGSIGMGKSATSEMFREQGIPVYDADASVHALYEAGGAAVEPIEDAFPGVRSKTGGIDRVKLREKVLDDPKAVKHLESIVHPLVGQVQLNFLQDQMKTGAKLVVLDIPLLFETGGNKRVDCVAVVSAPADIQRQRVLEREGMTEEVFLSILSKQVPDEIKREKADFVINTALGFDYARAQVKQIIDTLLSGESDH